MAQFDIKGASIKQIEFPKWIPMQQLVKIFDIIQKFNGVALLVGGCVRDIILDKESYDIDVACTFTPEKLIEIFQKEKGFKIVPTGIKHGTVTLLYDGINFELTTLRDDVECFGRDANVKYTTDWIVDSNRRDFTINAMYLNLDGTLYDFHNGFTDLKNKIVRFIGNPKRRIEEDYLRILRYFRFLSYYGGENLDQPSFDEIKLHAHNIQNISGERIQMEFKKLFNGEFASNSIKLMNQQGILYAIFDTNLQKDFTFYINQTYHGNFAICFAGLLHSLNKDNLELAKYSRKRLKLSNADYKLVYQLLSDIAQYADVEEFHKRLCYTNGKKYYKNFLQFLNIIGILHNKNCINWNMPEFPINPKDLIAIGIKGRTLGDTLKRLEEVWIKSNFTASKQQLMGKIKHHKFC